MDYDKAIQIADNVYWVGVNDKDAFFRTNAYLIKGDKESVLIDPGSIPQFEAIKKKVLSVVPKEQVKYAVASHQDPDVCSALVPFTEDGFKFKTIAHSRVSALLIFYSKNLEFYNIDQNNFKLTYDNGKTLEFIFTPYFHSPGAFATYYPDSKVLFTSDIFGAFQKSWQLFADKYYTEPMKAFNELYAPSKEIVNHSIKKFREKDIELLAPQHGSVIKKELIETMYSALENMNAGMFLENATVNILNSATMENPAEEILNDMLEIVKKRAALVLGEERVKEIIQNTLQGKDTVDYELLRQLVKNIKEENPLAIAVTKVPLVNYIMDNSEKFKGQIPELVKEIVYM